MTAILAGTAARARCNLRGMNMALLKMGTSVGIIHGPTVLGPVIDKWAWIPLFPAVLRSPVGCLLWPQYINQAKITYPYHSKV